MYWLHGCAEDVGTWYGKKYNEWPLWYVQRKRCNQNSTCTVKLWIEHCQNATKSRELTVICTSYFSWGVWEHCCAGPVCSRQIPLRATGPQCSIQLTLKSTFLLAAPDIRNMRDIDKWTRSFRGPYIKNASFAHKFFLCQLFRVNSDASDTVTRWQFCFQKCCHSLWILDHCTNHSCKDKQ